MHRIQLGDNGGWAVYMTTGTGNIDHDGRFELTPQCMSVGEVDWAADELIEEIEEWRKAAKKRVAVLRKNPGPFVPPERS